MKNTTPAGYTTGYLKNHWTKHTRLFVCILVTIFNNSDIRGIFFSLNNAWGELKEIFKELLTLYGRSTPKDRFSSFCRMI